MCVQPGHLSNQSSQPETALRAALQSRSFHLPSILFFGPVSAKNQKKLHLIWCKVHLTPLSSTELRKIRVAKTRKNEQKRPQFDAFRLFRAFYSTLSLCRIAASPTHFFTSSVPGPKAARCKVEGPLLSATGYWLPTVPCLKVWKVCIRYGEVWKRYKALP